MIKLLPIALFLVIAGFLAKGLYLDPREVPSPFIGKPAPQFQAAQLNAADTPFDSSSLLGQVWVLNIWASWCGPCLQEHPQFIRLAQQSPVQIVGLNYKDAAGDANTWLSRHGNPFSTVISDIEGRVGLDWGVYGVPETFVIDKNGTVRHKVIGPVTAEEMDSQLLPLLQELQGGQS